MKKVRLVAVILLICISALTLSGCGEKGDVKKTISSFEEAWKNADVEAALDCMSPAISSTVKMGFSIVGVTDLNEQFSKLLEFVGFVDFSGGSPGEVLESINIKPKKYEFNDKKTSCTVTALLQYEVGGNQKESEIKIKLKKEGEKWYISLIY